MIEMPDPGSIWEVADWVELSVSVAKDSLSKPSVASAVESSGGVASEQFIASVWRELERRQSLYCRSFFKVSARLVEIGSDAAQPEYIACLLLSLFGGHDLPHYPAKLFERLTNEAVGKYLTGRANVFGWPFDPDESLSGEEEPRIKRKIRYVANTVGERFGEAPAARFKDRGLDVIGWIPFEDRRSSQVAVLVQSTIEQDWRRKHSVPLDAWCQYIHWACDPIKAFSVPCIVRDHDWHEASRDKGILLDRARIVNLLWEGVTDLNLKVDIGAWVDRVITVLDD